MPTPAHPAIIDRDQHLDLALPSPGGQFLAIEQLTRAARAIENHQTSVTIAVLQDFVNDGAKRSQPDTARDDDDVVSPRCLHGPAHPKWTTNADPVAYCLRNQRVGGLSN